MTCRLCITRVRNITNYKFHSSAYDRVLARYQFRGLFCRGCTSIIDDNTQHLADPSPCWNDPPVTCHYKVGKRVDGVTAER